ncbi:hypothetical protein E2I00_001909 [Balaenoptera physalus]|uniref:Fringe-like glycosyltransferase domain-containing protein n=1 Tax=Balaenoptera physalus TaxID=9770 RepID=A0A6A1Q9K2_BALPH|nr:hypothetical protein E2I00_001909 [Balaenoptera physalus]
MAVEYDRFIESGRKWFCHVDDDNYVNVRALLRLLASYPHTQDIYLGKPSLDRPIQATERVSESKVVSVPPTQACAERGGGGSTRVPNLTCTGRRNSVHIKGPFSVEADPSRFRSIHCHLYPDTPWCPHTAIF